jgi:hypothetical protein
MNKNRGHTKIPENQLIDNENPLPIEVATNHKSEIIVIKGNSMWGRRVVKKVKKIPENNTEK